MIIGFTTLLDLGPAELPVISFEGSDVSTLDLSVGFTSGSLSTSSKSLSKGFLL